MNNVLLDKISMELGLYKLVKVKVLVVLIYNLKRKKL